MFEEVSNLGKNLADSAAANFSSNSGPFR